MANELWCRYLSASNIYAHIRRRTDGQLYNGVGFEAPLTAHWGNYAVAAVEQDTTGYYYANLSSLSPGVYDIAWFLRAGGSPAAGDAVVWLDHLDWSGSTDLGVTHAADSYLARNQAGGFDGGRTVRDSFRATRNRIAFDVPSAGQFTVFMEDDATPAWVGTYQRGPNTLGPLTGVDPA